jgi:hypothetical protein
VRGTGQLVRHHAELSPFGPYIFYHAKAQRREVGVGPTGNSTNRCLIPEITRSAKNTVAPAKAGAYDVCMGRPTDEIGPSLRWGDGCCATSISSASTKGIAPTATSSP